MLNKTTEWNKLSDSKGEKVKFIKKGKQFSELLETSINNLDDGIILPLPEKPELQNIDPDDNFDQVKPLSESPYNSYNSTSNT